MDDTQQPIGVEDKIYKLQSDSKNNIYPGDPEGLPDDALIFLDSGFLSRLSKHFGRGAHISYDLIKSALNLAQRQRLRCKKIFYFTAPPFQSNPPTQDENIKSTMRPPWLKSRGLGRRSCFGCRKFLVNLEFSDQRIAQSTSNSLCSGSNRTMNGAVCLRLPDIMKLSFTPLDFPEIKKVILVSSDTDFCPVIKELQHKGIQVILYSYHERKRNTNLSVSTELIKCCSKYCKLIKEDFESAAFDKFQEKVS